MMLEDDDYSSGSDEDYIPSEGEAVSEEDDSGEEENLDALGTDATVLEGRKRRKNVKDLQKRKRKGGIKLDGANETEANGDVSESVNTDLEKQIKAEMEARKAEEEKKKADNLWSSFISDVGTPARKHTTNSTSSASPTLGSLAAHSKSVVASASSANSKPGTVQKIAVTKEFDFAGEIVSVTEEVDMNSKEGKAAIQNITEVKAGTVPTTTAGTSSEKSDVPGTSVTKPSQLGGLGSGLKRPSVGGLGGLLDKINKKQKISTLEKSKLDWTNFKQAEKIDDDLQIHNRGKDGYIERLKFLERTDQRQFEIERSLRQSSSSKR
ncbi:hypothetical protein ACJMK2_009640 [Sinanodonta woodiana]|uniref:Craniofacial development protein 1 n=1 Tax=Sinanodonta woodiana TaxID=1069815 RepID=A0ABD3VFU8_SINWO